MKEADPVADKLQALIDSARAAVESSHEQARDLDELLFRPIDEFLADPQKSRLEKAAYLLLNQFPGDHKTYLVVPSEHCVFETSTTCRFLITTTRSISPCMREARHSR